MRREMREDLPKLRFKSKAEVLPEESGSFFVPKPKDLD